MKKIFLVIFTFICLMLAVRGNLGNPTETSINDLSWTENGPLELSPERGRFALLMSLVENKSFYFSLPLARLATPDLGYTNGHYVSLFAPGVSFLTIPGYLLGKELGISQVGTFLMVSLFAVINVLLIRQIAILYGAGSIGASLGAIAFIFGTPAFAYGVTLYQHHISTFLILLAIYLLKKWNNFWSLSLIWALCATSIIVDYPNLFLMFPIGMAALMQIVRPSISTTIMEVEIKWKRLFTFLVMLLPLFVFGWFNKSSYGNPWQLSGTIPSVRQIDINGNPTAPKGADFEDVEKYINPETQHKSAVGFFKSRYLVNGLFIHLLSPDRGIIFYCPVVLVGILGFVILYKRRTKYFDVLAAVVMMDILLYSMWGDPWGGWAFGSRYLIPGYAILSIFIGVALSRFSKNILVVILFGGLMIYSTTVNTLGALTSSRNPPKVEILELEKISGRVQRYTYERNWEMISNNDSKSFVFQTYGNKYMDAKKYFIFLTMLINLVVISQLIKIRKENYEN